MSDMILPNSFPIAVTVALAVGAGFWINGAGADTNVRIGQAAYGDWRSDSPGVIRKITPNDMPPVVESLNAANPSSVVPRPHGAQLKTMVGFVVRAFASGIDGARVIRTASNGDIFVAQSRSGKVTVLRPNKEGTEPSQIDTFVGGLNRPFGIAFYPPGPNPAWVYVAETTRVVRFSYKTGDLKASTPPEPVITGLPSGGHWTRDIAFSADGKTLYLSVGSSSNVGEDLSAAPDLVAWEKAQAMGAAWGHETGRAMVLAFDPDGTNRRIVATGIRNCSGLAVQLSTEKVYCATNERDLLGDNLPPDYVTSIKQGAFYGWPWYYIGSHEDPRHSAERPDLASKISVPDVLLQPHSAPLALAFNTGKQFPAAWNGDAFVALHGSWNRATHTGYKIVRIPFKEGSPTGEYQDFVTGFAVDQQSVWGRPVGVAFEADGSLLFSDDEGGIIWRVSYSGG